MNWPLIKELARLTAEFKTASAEKKQELAAKIEKIEEEITRKKS